MVAGLDEAAGQMFELLARLDEQVSTRRYAHGDTLPRVACPDVETWVSRATVDGKEVEVCVKPGQNAVLLSILLQIGRRRGEKMRSIGNASVCTGGVVCSFRLTRIVQHQ